MPLILALDQSTSATKGLLLDENGRSLDREARNHQQYYPQPGWVEHDAEEIWQNTLFVLRTLVARQADRLAEVVGLSLTNQRETVVLFDRATGRPLAPAIVWQCRRTMSLCSEQVTAGREDAIRTRTGLPIDAYFSASKVQWWVRQDPTLAARLAAGEALIGTIDTYLIYRLTGGKIFATDSTNASRTQLFDLHKLAWDAELCAWWQVPMQCLAEVRESAANFGTTTLDGALTKPLPICGVIGDSQAALFAQRCFASGTAKVTLGTGSSVLLNIGSQPRASGRGLATALAWVHRGVPTYAFEGIIITSAATLTWLRDQLGFVAQVAEIEALARSVEDNGGVYLVPAFAGLGFPHWQPAARGALVGLSGHTDRRHVARAALEAIAYQIRDALDVMRAEAGVDLRALHADGGPTANRALMQFTADLTGTDLRVATLADASALGAAQLGLIGLGHLASVDAVAALPRGETTYSPAMPASTVARLYAGWQCAVRQTLTR